MNLQQLVYGGTHLSHAVLQLWTSVEECRGVRGSEGVREGVREGVKGMRGVVTCNHQLLPQQGQNIVLSRLWAVQLRFRLSISNSSRQCGSTRGGGGSNE
jgi:hypothetical protein